MLRWSYLFLLIALTAAFFGFTGIAEEATGIVRVLFTIFTEIWFIFVCLSIVFDEKEIKKAG